MLILTVKSCSFNGITVGGVQNCYSYLMFLDYCCPLKLRPSRARVCMHMQASKNKKLGWLLFEESALFGNFAATKQTSLPKYGQRYTFSRTADTKSATKLLQQAKNSSNQPRIGWREVCKDV